MNLYKIINRLSTWNSRNPERAVAAVNKIKSETTLMRAALNAHAWQARQAAVQRLSGDEAMDFCKLIVRNDIDSDVKRTALDKLSGDKYQDFFVETAMTNSVSHIRKAAIDKITDIDKITQLIANSGTYLLGGPTLTRDEYADILVYIHKIYKDETIRQMIRLYEGTPLTGKTLKNMDFDFDDPPPPPNKFRSRWKTSVPKEEDYENSKFGRREPGQRYFVLPHD
ncbi:MAG: hypothetical protein LBD21_04075 [Tannerellaceae bacterium]|jgi:hypothetical protein|nr:hypothetical protein [Tannerellaceae bacterium]